MYFICTGTTRNPIYDETKISDMCHMLDEELNSYIPVKRQIKRIFIEGKEFEINDSKVFPILLFGDQLTVARGHLASVI